MNNWKSVTRLYHRRKIKTVVIEGKQKDIWFKKSYLIMKNTRKKVGTGSYILNLRENIYVNYTSNIPSNSKIKNFT